MKRALLFVVLGLSTASLAAEPPNADLSSLRDITGIETLPPAPAPPQWPYAVAVGSAVALVLGVAGWRWARRFRPAPTVSPERWALQELDRIERLQLLELGKMERFYTLLADAIRTYAQLQLNLQAPRQTTAEFLISLQKSTVPAAMQERLRAFLMRCDLAKFAQAHYGREDCLIALEQARAFVQQTAGQKLATDDTPSDLVRGERHR
jgi:hypothetical protein